MIITPEIYLMGRDKEYPLDFLQCKNMADLLSRVNWLLAHLNLDLKLSSGYRPGRYNKTVGGSKMSTHTMCAGIDLIDPNGEVGKKLKANPLLLEKCGLWLEDPVYTVKGNVFWTHLDIKNRKNRIFIP